VPKVFTRTYFDLTLADINSITFTRSGTSWVIVVNGGVRANDGQGYTAILTKDITTGQKAQIENFISTHALPLLNTQEKLQ